eukprot:5798190-Pyramimonas_sp.AAC.1
MRPSDHTDRRRPKVVEAARILAMTSARWPRLASLLTMGPRYLNSQTCSITWPSTVRLPSARPTGRTPERARIHLVFLALSSPPQSFTVSARSCAATCSSCSEA